MRGALQRPLGPWGAGPLLAISARISDPYGFTCISGGSSRVHVLRSFGWLYVEEGASGERRAGTAVSERRLELGAPSLLACACWPSSVRTAASAMACLTNKEAVVVDRRAADASAAGR